MRKTTSAVLRQLVPRAPVFTTATAAAAAGVSRDAASRDLSLAASAGLIIRLKRGVWALPTHPDFSPFAAVPYLLGGEHYSDLGYVSAVSGLALHGMIQQMPGSIHVMVREQRRPLETPVGTYEFHKISPELFGGFSDFGSRFTFPVATPAKALFDTLLLSASRGRRYAHLPELRLPAAFSRREMTEWISTIQSSRKRSAVSVRWAALSAEIKLQQSAAA